jgi:hypothetical protein
MASRKVRFLVLGSVAAVLVLGLALLGVGLLIGLWWMNRADQRARFKGSIDGYLAVSKEQTELGEYLKGKAVVVNVKDKEVDDEVFSRLPAELRAGGPDEVGTVVLLKWGRELAGVYVGKTSAGAGYRHVCEVVVIDKGLGAIVARKVFRGSEPPSERRGGTDDIYGSRPVDDIVTYLAQLPREAAGAEAAPKGWVVLFRSDDPSVWNTDSPGDNFAVPLRKAPRGLRYLRLKRLDTGGVQILPVTFDQLGREARPEVESNYWWNGSAHLDWGGRHLGVAQPRIAAGKKGPIVVSRHNNQDYLGSGFGHKAGVDDKQYCCWHGQEIARTAFEIAVSTGPLTETEKADLVGPDPEEGPTPKGWVVLFRSDDPSVWNTVSPGASFAVPLCRAHSKIGHLRLKRLDTGNALIVPVTRDLLGRARPPEDKGHAWNGSARLEWGGCHLGIVQGPRLHEHRTIAVLNESSGWFTGSGFGHKTAVDDKQYYCWQGQEVPRTAFEIAVTAQPLTEEEKRLLPVYKEAVKPVPELPKGTPVPNAIAQPPAPPTPAGKSAVDLIPLVDPTRDAVHGRWLVVGPALHCNDRHNVPRLQFPYQPPAEYDFVVTFSQPQLGNGISLIMPNQAGGSFFCTVGYLAGTGFTLQKPGPLQPGLQVNKPYTATAQVRKDGVTLLLDGKVLEAYRGDFKNLPFDNYHEIRDRSLLAVACDDPTVFHYILVVEVSGAGKESR